MPGIRADIRPENVARLIDQKGYKLTHQSAIPCPCLDVATGQPDPTCARCEGKGWQYYGEKTIRAICVGLGMEKQYVDPGGFFLGTMTLTTHAANDLGYHDRIINQESVIRFSEVMDRAVGNVDKTRFEIQSVSRVIDPAGNLYQPTTHFTVSGRQITWLGATRPAGRYSIAYMVHPCWLVLNHLHVIRDTWVKFQRPADTHTRLPIQVLAKLEWLVD